MMLDSNSPAILFYRLGKKKEGGKEGFIKFILIVSDAEGG